MTQLLFTRLRMLPVLGVMGLIFYLSHQPGDSLHLPDIINIDKLLHCLAYTTLGLAYLVALPPRWRQFHPWPAAVSVVLFCLLYGASDEFHQSFIPGRFVSGADLAADCVGGLVAVVFFWGWRRWHGSK